MSRTRIPSELINTLVGPGVTDETSGVVSRNPVLEFRHPFVVTPDHARKKTIIGSANIGVMTYSTPGTYVVPIPSTAKILRVPCLVGGGGGGGGGRCGGAGTIRCGGGGGGGAGRSTAVFNAADLRALGSDLTVIVGAGMAGGAGAATDDTNGKQGGGGFPVSSIDVNGIMLVYASPGTSGTGGTGSGAPPGLGGKGAGIAEWPGGEGGSSATDGGSTGLTSPGATSGGAGGGGAGAGITTANKTRSGSIGGTVLPRSTSYRALGGSNPGGDGSTRDGEPTFSWAGIGGGGGASAVGAPGGKGGDGQQPGGGGGGGGASENGYPSGAGGKGGDGIAVLIWEY